MGHITLIIESCYTDPHDIISHESCCKGRSHEPLTHTYESHQAEANRSFEFVSPSSSWVLPKWRARVSLSHMNESCLTVTHEWVMSHRILRIQSIFQVVRPTANEDVMSHQHTQDVSLWHTWMMTCHSDTHKWCHAEHQEADCSSDPVRPIANKGVMSHWHTWIGHVTQDTEEPIALPSSCILLQMKKTCHTDTYGTCHCRLPSSQPLFRVRESV